MFLFHFFFKDIFFTIVFFVLGSISASFLLCVIGFCKIKLSFPYLNVLSKIRLPFYTLIPLLSYLFLLGKCHSCKKNIELRYPLSEIIYGVLFVLIWQKLGFVWASPFFLFSWSLLFFIF